MKTTIEISAPLLEAAKKLAGQTGTTLRALVEMGLRRVLEEQESPRTAYRLVDRSVPGRGLQGPFRDASWDEIRDTSYEGRGG